MRDNQIFISRPARLKAGEQLRRFKPLMLVIEIVLIDKARLHPGACPLDTMFRSMVEWAGNGIKPMQLPQDIGYDGDFLDRIDGRRQQVLSRHGTQQQPVPSRFMGGIKHLGTGEARRSQPAQPRRLVLQLTKRASRLRLDEQSRLSRRRAAEHGRFEQPVVCCAQS